MEHSEKQNSAGGFYIFADDSTAFGTGKTGLTISVELSKAGGTFNSVSPTITERGLGHYHVLPTAAHRDTLGRIAWRFSATGAVIAPRYEKVVAVDDQDADFGFDPTDYQISQPDVRAAVGLSAADLDAQLSGLSADLVIIDDFLDTEMAETLGIVQKLEDLVEDDGGTWRLTLNAFDNVGAAIGLAANDLDGQLGGLSTGISDLSADLVIINDFLDTEMAETLGIVQKLEDLVEDDGGTWRLTLNAFDNVGAAIGLASNDLGTQLAGISADLAIIDQNIDDIEIIAEKLDDTLEDNAGAWRFTAAALFHSGGGGGGGGVVTGFTVGALRELYTVDVDETPVTGSIVKDAQGAAGGSVDVITINGQNAADFFAGLTTYSLSSALHNTVTKGGAVTIIQGDEYKIANGTSLNLEFDDADMSIFTRFNAADEIKFGMGRNKKADQLAGTGSTSHVSGKTYVHFEFTKEATAAACAGDEYEYHLQLTESGDPFTYATGCATVRLDRAA